MRRSREKMDNLQTQASTLKRLNRPSDDPSAVGHLLRIRSEKANVEQFQLNSKLAENSLMLTDRAIADLNDIVTRARELAIGQSSSASSSEDSRRGISEEVSQLFQQVLSIASRRVGDRYLFGGYKNQAVPVDSSGRFLGDHGQTLVEIGEDVYISTNIPGSELFNTQPQPHADARGMSPYSESGPENVNLFEELQRLNVGLLTGDLATIRDTLDRFDQLSGHLITVRAKVGSRLQGLQSTYQALERQQVSGAVISSALEDADMAQVMSDLNKEESVFKSSLAVSKRLIQPTLLEFLR
jgi:flagellar hook-associated protein 3 FlgL